MVGLKRGVGGERINNVQSSLRAERHGDGYGAIEFDNRTRSELRERGVKRRDAWPVGSRWRVCARVAGGDGRLQRVRTSRAIEPFGLPEFSEAVTDQRMVPASAILIGKQNWFASRVGASVSARSLDFHQRHQPMHFRLVRSESCENAAQTEGVLNERRAHPVFAGSSGVSFVEN